jgi:hypothetical protein
VNEDVAATEIFRRARQPRLIALGIVVHVERIAMRFAWIARDRGERRIDPSLIAREKGNIGALGGEELDDLESDAVRPAVHDDLFARQPQFHRIAPCLVLAMLCPMRCRCQTSKSEGDNRM